MLADPMLETDERARGRVLAAYDVDGATRSGMLDDLVEYAAELCGAPIAVVSLIEEEYQRFLSRVGLTELGVDRNISICVHAMLGIGVMEVSDARDDPRFTCNPMVTGAAQVRFYAGAPLVSSEGVPLGALCVIDTAPREGLTDLQRRGLEILAKAAMGRLDDRRVAREQAVGEAMSRRALEDSELRFRTLADTMPQMVWSALPDGFHDYYNARWYAFTGAPEGTTDGEGWNDMFHPDDQDRAWSRWRHSLATGDPYSIEYRLRHVDGTYRWVLGRALPIRDEAGAITRWFGTCTDIHEQKLASEEREVVSQELSHRIKNIFAVVSGLIAFAARSRPDFAGVAGDLRERVTALGRAHDFVRPHSVDSQPAARQDSLKGLLTELFGPYQRDDGERIGVIGDDLAIDDRSATPLALLFHELATNATKYGALSNDMGQVSVTIARTATHAQLRWVEQDGPTIATAPESSGFGSQLIEMSAVRQMGGTVTRDWKPTGLDLFVAVPLPALIRQPAS